MLYYYNQSKDPFFNLALEELLLKSSVDNIFMLWRNQKAVIVGRNQNINQEVDIDFAKHNQIPIVRRITGGGAVYHDLGTINFSFITTKEYTVEKLLYLFLERLCIDSLTTERNDVLMNGKKIIGTAQYENGDRRLFHGSVLFDTDLVILGKVLTPCKEKLDRHSVSSVLSRVANLKELILTTLNTDEFMEKLVNFNCDAIPENYIEQALLLSKSKYETHEWRDKI